MRGWLAGVCMLKGYELAGVDIDAIAPATELKRISPRPLLLLSGGVDGDTPPFVMDQVLETCGKPSQMWRLPAVGHGGYLEAEPQAYEALVIGFLDGAFGPTATL
jgi:pimeloyl-ACP methyl ester carboxylesterase